ncbi:hypothetical protein [Roseateles noduli]|uniref:hypothetical protein n=1 Tax=Roseateles noduli TaxID=2052484 RepID=UPI003D6551FC
MSGNEDKGWARREVWKFLLRCGFGFFVAFMVKLAGFGERIPNFVLMTGSMLCIVYLLDLLCRTWRHRRHRARRPSGAKGDQPIGEEDV